MHTLRLPLIELVSAAYGWLQVNWTIVFGGIFVALLVVTIVAFLVHRD